MNEVYGLVVVVVVVIQAREEAQRNALTPPLGGEGGGIRERCLRQHVLWAWSNAKEIYCLARVFMAYPRFVRYIFTRGSSAECTSRPNNCFWKCEQRALINASVALERSVSYDLLRRGGEKVCVPWQFCFYFDRRQCVFCFYFNPYFNVSIFRCYVNRIIQSITKI